jgi:Transposase
MTHYVGLDVSQKTTAICVVDSEGRRIWRGVCSTTPEGIERAVRRYAGNDARIGLETGPMTPWLFDGLRELRLDVVCLDARHARAALRMQINKTDQNDAEGLAQVMRTGWYRAVHVKSFAAHRARALLGARTQLEPHSRRAEDVRPPARRHAWDAFRPPRRSVDRRPARRRAYRAADAFSLAGAPRADRCFRQGDLRARPLQPDLPVAYERAWNRRAVGAGVCQHDRGGPALPTIAGNRGTPRANAAQVPVRRDRPQRTHIALRRRSYENAHVRSCRCDPNEGEASLAPERLGARDCEAIGTGKGTRGAGA